MHDVFTPLQATFSMIVVGTHMQYIYGCACVGPYTCVCRPMRVNERVYLYDSATYL